MSRTPSDPRPTFLCDLNLGRLAKRLRLMGFDARYMRGWDEERVTHALREGRVLLTRKRSLKGMEGCIVMESDHVEEQIARLDAVLHIGEKIQPFSRCSVCNLPIIYVMPKDVKDRVPEYVYATQETFARCPGCSRIYWKGTHFAVSMSSLRMLRRVREDT